MKICLITNLYKPYQRGGAEKVIEIIINELKKAQQVVILTTAPVLKIKSFKKIVKEDNLKIYYLFNWNIYHLLNDYKFPWLIRLIWHFIDLFNIIIWKITKKILIREKPDFIWTHNLKGYSLGLPGIINQLGFKHLHQLHDLQLIDPAGTLYRPKKGNLQKLSFGLKIYSYFTKKFTKSITRVISPSNFTLNWHKKLGFFHRAKTLVLANPVEGVGAEPPPPQAIGVPPAAGRHPQSPLTLLYLGQLEEQKGVIFLINTFKKANNPDLQLSIAGRGSQEIIIKNLTKEDSRIKFFNFLDKKQLVEIFQQTDLTVIPSLCYENSPTVIYESYLSGVPVLVSDSGGQVELVEENKTGLIFKTGDERDLLEKINYFYNNRELINSWRSNILEKIKDYGAEEYIRKIFSFIKFHT